MPRSRLLRRCLSGLVLLALLHAQLAIAAFVCERISTPAEPATAMVWDDEQGALCQQHCQFGSAQQGVDLGAGIGAAPSLPVALYPVGIVEPAALRVATWLGHQRQRERSPPPPHSLLHCCLRT